VDVAVSPPSFGALVRLNNFHFQDRTEFCFKAGLYIFGSETISEFADEDLEIMEVLSNEDLLLTDGEFLAVADVFHESRRDHEKCLILAFFFDELYVLNIQVGIGEG
jgi:hypothetical protein